MEMDRARVINNKLPLQIALVQFEAVFFFVIQQVFERRYFRQKLLV